MTTGEKLSADLNNNLSAHAWYGTPIYQILDTVTFDSAYEKPSPVVHSVIEIVLHMMSWTEEMMDRMNGMEAAIPSSGDWPNPGAPDEQKWKLWIDDFKLANVNLTKIIGDFPDEQWQAYINDNRGTEPLSTYEQMITGFIQHQIYHAGQIALLVKMING